MTLDLPASPDVATPSDTTAIDATSAVVTGQAPADVAFVSESRLDPRWYTPCMANLEKLHWIDAFTLGGYGARVGVRVSDAALIPALAARLPQGVKPAAPGTVDRVLSVIAGGAGERRGQRRYHMLYADHMSSGRSHKLDQVLEGYDTWLGRTFAQFSRRKMFVHAGCVAWQDRVILLPGNTFTGKSSLTMALVEAGATYLSDEYAIVDDRGMVHPYVKPIAMREPTTRQRMVDVGEIGGKIASRPLPVGAVVLTEFAADARWRPRRISPGVATLEMMKYTVGAQMNPEQTLNVLSAVASKSLIFKTKRPDVKDTVPLLLAMVERSWNHAVRASS